MRFKAMFPLWPWRSWTTTSFCTAPDAVARFDRQGQAKFHQYYKTVWNSASAKAGAVPGFFLSPFNMDPLRMERLFAQRYMLNARDGRYSYFLFESATFDNAKRFDIVCVEQASGKELGTLWVNERNTEIFLDATSRTV